MMTDSLKSVWQDLWQTVKRIMTPMFLIHLVFVMLGVALFTPLLGLVGKLLLGLSGSAALSDFDIAFFILSPAGIFSLVLFGGLLITVTVFEQASQMVCFAGSRNGSRLEVGLVLLFVGQRVKKIFYFSIHLVFRILFVILPFLGLALCIAWLLISDYDINYYLKEKPPVFLLTVAVDGVILLAMVWLLLKKLISWSMALPLLLFDDLPPVDSFAKSRQLTRENSGFLFSLFGSWAVASLLLAWLMLGGLQLFASQLVPRSMGSISGLIIVLTTLLIFWLLTNFLVTTLTSGSFGGLLVLISEKRGYRLNSSIAVDQPPHYLFQRSGLHLTLLLLVCVGVAAVFGGSGLLYDIRTNDDCEVIAHRGAAGKAPENTLASIEQALADNTDWVEIDVQETVDGEIVVVHDSDFMKLAKVNLKVWEGTLSRIGEIDIGSWFDPKFSSERVPTLRQVLEAARGKARVLIELKYYGHDEQLEKRVAEIVEQTGMVDDVAFMSLKYDGIKKLRALRPEWKVGLLLSAAVGDLSKLDVDFFAVNLKMAKASFVRRQHKAGKQVFVWTVNEPLIMSRVMSLGVDGIITDEPAMAGEVLAQRGELSSGERLLVSGALLLGKPVPQRVYRDQSP
ncbi:MAG: glycerophosphodiester phosphodiesterase [Thermodesulfobacteriota bacterium]